MTPEPGSRGVPDPGEVARVHERPVITETADGVATILLNRPERRNAMTRSLLDELLAALEALTSDDDIRVIVLTGAGSSFCVGGDLAEGLAGINGPPPAAAQAGQLRRLLRISQLLHDAPSVTIAAVNGACAGAGLSLALACDLAIAANTAVFASAFLGAGVSGDFGGIWFATRRLGTGAARRLFLLGERADAEAAAGLGIVSEVTASDDLLPRARELASDLAARAPLALRRMKANLNDATCVPLAAYLDAEAGRHAACCASADAAEAAQAFVAKRAPRFTGQ